MSDFLKTEYEQCLLLMKFYDERQFNLVKYSATVTSAVPTLLATVYKLGNEANEFFWHFVLVAAVASIISITSIFFGMVQTRLYFVYPARQVNAIRSYLMKQHIESGFDNQMYVSTKFNAFKFFSTQSLMMLFVAIEIGFFVALSYYSTLKIATVSNYSLLISLALGTILSTILVVISGSYLHFKSKDHPDRSIHKEE